MTKKKILIVEDNPANFNILNEILSKNHYNVLKATDGEEALIGAKHHIPNLIIAESNILKVPITKVAGFLKKDKQLNQIPLIVIQKQSYNTQNHQFDVLLQKPFSKNKLLNIVKQNVK